MSVSVERAVCFLSGVFARKSRSGESPFEGAGGRTTEQIAHDILHMEMADPEPVLLAARVVALDRILRGGFPGIPKECGDPVSGVVLSVIQAHCVPGGVPDEVYFYFKDLKNYDPCGDCDMLCSEQPDPELKLSPEEYDRDRFTVESPRFMSE